MGKVRLRRQERLLKKNAGLISGFNKHGRKVERQPNNAFPAKKVKFQFMRELMSRPDTISVDPS